MCYTVRTAQATTTKAGDTMSDYAFYGQEYVEILAHDASFDEPITLVQFADGTDAWVLSDDLTSAFTSPK